MSDNIVEKYILTHARQLLERREKQQAERRTVQELERHRAAVRTFLSQHLEKLNLATELDLKTVARRERNGVIVENLMFHSLPKMVVTANLYLPERDRTNAKIPVVLCLPSGSVEGKAASASQRLGQALAQRGMAALVYDGISCGERVQLYDITLRGSWLGHTPHLEWDYLSNLLSLTGNSLASFLLADARAALAAISARDELDVSRLGLIAAGKAVSTARLLCALQPEIQAAALVLDANDAQPLTAATSDQLLPGALAQGFIELDYLGCFAPRPLLLLSGNAHHSGEMPAEIARYSELQHWYRMFDRANAFETIVLDGGNGFGKPLRSAVVNFLSQTFGLGSGVVRESSDPVEAYEALACTETGQVANALNGQDIFEFHRRHLLQNDIARFEIPLQVAEAKKLQAQLRAEATRLLRISMDFEPAESSVESHSRDWGMQVEKGSLGVEPGIYVPYSFYSAPSGTQREQARPAVLAIHERGIKSMSSQGPWMTHIANAGSHIITIDVRGTGETGMPRDRSDAEPYALLLGGPESVFARQAVLLGRTLFGGRVFDVLRTLEYLRSRPDVNKDKISLLGVGRASLWALYAAALTDFVDRTILFRGLTRYSDLVGKRRQNHHTSLYLHGVLKHFDLPHIAACVAPRKLTIINPVNNRRERYPAETASEAYQFTQQMYQAMHSPERFRVRSTDSLSETLVALSETLGVELTDSGVFEIIG